MSRLIVKNLPKNISEEKLKELFNQKGTITDIQLKYTKDGVFRQFAFIGYRTDDEADAARKYFNNSFIQTSKVKVETCAPLGALEKPKSWSKYSADSFAFKKTHGIDKLEEEAREKAKEERRKERKKKDPISEIIGEHKDEPEFVEFMQAHSKNQNLWANDAAMGAEGEVKNAEVKESTGPDKKSGKNTVKVPEEKQESDLEDEDDGADDSDQDHAKEDEEDSDEKLAEKTISDTDYMKSLMKKPDPKKDKTKSKEASQIDLFTIKIHDLPFKTKRQDVLKFFKPLKPYSVRIPRNIRGFCYVGFKTEADYKRGMQKNKSFIKGKQVFFSEFTEKNKISKDKSEGKDVSTVDANKNSKWSKQEENNKNEEDISESGRIFFRNLAYIVTEDELQKLFEKFGPVAEISLPIDPLTRQIKGFGTVTFVMPEHAVMAFGELDGTLFHGRLLHLIPGKSRDTQEDPEMEGLGYKAKKALKLKQTASSSHNWNTLFLGANAVADILAKQFETTKEKILDSDKGGSSAAVRLALGETQIVQEMKKFLEENDVQLKAFDTITAKRSKTVILAKNLPAETEISDLKPLFSKFGLVGRIVLPPSGVTALIEFLDPSEAKQAFKKLAYSKFKNLPLYLEWAPENTFKTAAGKLDGKVETVDQKKEGSEEETEVVEESKVETEVVENTQEDEEADEPPEPNTTIFLRNLNFKTHEDAIREHFRELGTIHIIQVARRKDPENPRNKISLGYGFIQFKKTKIAEKALKQMQFTQIEGNQVELKRSDRILKADEATNRKKSTATKQTGSKILVRNIPFQATQKEIRDIFKAFGELKSVRLPKKMTPGEESHRGFGFVDFTNKGDAKKAFEALCQSTHLYGRRLVLEWASVDDNDVDELRKRTAENYHGSINAKRSRKGVFDAEAVERVADENENDM